MERHLRHSRTLNEGRSINSGDTWTGSGRFRRPCICAQRRPEYKLRRHIVSLVVALLDALPLNEGRSINSGDTRWRRSSGVSGLFFAQRRPEYKLRRHASTTARPGAVTCSAQRRPEYKLRRHLVETYGEAAQEEFAQRRPEYKLRRHMAGVPRGTAETVALNEGRSINSGDTPARPSCRRSSPALNEGRSINSGDTDTFAWPTVTVQHRSTKAGV